MPDPAQARPRTPQKSRCPMHASTPLLTRLAPSQARCEALFASALQPSDTPGRRHDRYRHQVRRAAVRPGRLHRAHGPGVRGSPRRGVPADALGAPARRLARGTTPDSARHRAARTIPPGPRRPPGSGSTQPNQPQDRPGPVLVTHHNPSIHPSIPSGARPCPQPPDHRSPARTARLPTTWPGPPAYGSPPCAAGRPPARSGRQVPARRSHPEGTPDEPAFLVLDTAVPRRKRARQIIEAMRPAARPLTASGKEPS